jgi:hypothetical protein
MAAMTLNLQQRGLLLFLLKRIVKSRRVGLADSQDARPLDLAGFHLQQGMIRLI